MTTVVSFNNYEFYAAIASLFLIYVIIITAASKNLDFKEFDSSKDIYDYVWKKTLWLPAMVYLIIALYLCIYYKAYTATIFMCLVVSMVFSAVLQLIMYFMIMLRRRALWDTEAGTVKLRKQSIILQLKESGKFLIIFYPIGLALTIIFQILLHGHL
jgi:hypothetical protein